jgi:3-oxoacyl-[acyl-carrier-protein] synthase-3
MHMTAADENLARARSTVEKCLRAVLPRESPLPDYDADWIQTGLLDSMAHVDVLLAIESALNAPKLFGQLGGALPTTLRTAVETICIAISTLTQTETPQSRPRLPGGAASAAGFVGWGSALGSDRVSIRDVEQEFQLSSPVLAKSAGIDSICRVSATEDEVVLGKRAAQHALHQARVSVQDLDWIIATSETFLGFPSFAASLHAALLASAVCQVLDIGGACIGLLNGLAVANALCADPRVQCVLIVSSDVHTRILNPAKVPGRFGGLFGDGASAFVLQRHSHGNVQPYVVHASLGGCTGAFSSLLRIRPGTADSIYLEFDGKGLARAAVDRMERIITDVEKASGVSRAAFSAFALHQPNPRLLDTLITRTNLAADKVPLVAKHCGNLGSSTCGVALTMALDSNATKFREARGPILAASLGPGMAWTGLFLD